MSRPSFVVDASVAAKWVLPEPGSQQAGRRELTAAEARICYRGLLDDPNTHIAARERRCGLVTADERLYAALHPAYSWIELLCPASDQVQDFGDCGRHVRRRALDEHPAPPKKMRQPGMVHLFRDALDGVPKKGAIPG